MKKIIIIIFIIAIMLLGGGFLLISKNSSKLTSPQATNEQEKAPSQEKLAQPPSEKLPFDTNDNLDQAIQDLNQIE